jgi:hypothetical protein
MQRELSKTEQQESIQKELKMGNETDGPHKNRSRRMNQAQQKSENFLYKNEHGLHNK